MTTYFREKEFLVPGLGVGQGGSAADGVDQEESVARAVVSVAHSGNFVLELNFKFAGNHLL